MVAVPAVIPVTTPPVLTVAMPVLLLLHTPPLVASASVVVPPVHTVVDPVIVPADGVPDTVTVVVVLAVPQLLVTV